MNFYEFSSPYYALIKAENEELAVQTYIECVAGEQNEFDDLLDECEVKPSDYAIARFAQGKGEASGQNSIVEILEILRSDQPEVLLIDGSLI